MKKKKRAWNSSNPLFRWLHRKHHVREVKKMVRRRSSSGGRGFGLGGLKPVLVGLGVYSLASMFGVRNPIITGAAGYLVGGPMAAIGGAAPALLSGQASNTGSSVFFYG